nr:ABC-type oligopeptide transport system, periplasmiccomponent [Candidatus Pantoea persica]
MALTASAATSWASSQYIEYSRVKDYWAADLPVNCGRFNFDTLRYDYYLDDNVAFEAFNAGAFDLREEGSAKTRKAASRCASSCCCAAAPAMTGRCPTSTTCHGSASA